MGFKLWEEAIMSDICTKPWTQEYEDGFERIFNMKKGQKLDVVQQKDSLLSHPKPEKMHFNCPKCIGGKMKWAKGLGYRCTHCGNTQINRKTGGE